MSNFSIFVFDELYLFSYMYRSCATSDQIPNKYLAWNITNVCVRNRKTFDLFVTCQTRSDKNGSKYSIWWIIIRLNSFQPLCIAWPICIKFFLGDAYVTCKLVFETEEGNSNFTVGVQRAWLLFLLIWNSICSSSIWTKYFSY